MLNSPKISVVIPVYNCEKYLRKCLDSIRFQTYGNLEIICINDGSSDGSLKILEEYGAKDSRFKIHTQENSGVAITRNRGIDLATGDYISFIDSDDWVLLTLYKTFVEYVSKTDKLIDIWMYNASGYFRGKNDVVPLKFYDSTDWQNHKNDYSIHTFDDCLRPFSRNLSACNKIFRREFINQCKIKFPENLKYEDAAFIVLSYLNAQSIMLTDEVFYRYRNYESGSFLTTISDKAFDIFEIMSIIEHGLKSKGVWNRHRYAFFQYKYITYFNCYSQCTESLRRKYYEQMKSDLQKLASELEPQIYTRLMNYSLYKKIYESDWATFDVSQNM